MEGRSVPGRSPYQSSQFRNLMSQEAIMTSSQNESDSGYRFVLLGLGVKMYKFPIKLFQCN